MLAMLPLQMAYLLVGQRAHEWMGACLVILLAAHCLANRKAFLGLFRGTRSPIRVVNLALNHLVLAAALGLLLSGAHISGHVFVFLEISSGFSLARTVHLLCAFWGFVFFSLHLGLNLERMLRLAGLARPSPRMAGPRTAWARTPGYRILGWVARVAANLFGVFGLWLFGTGDLPLYMSMSVQFAFFDLDTPLWLFVGRYVAMMAGFALVGYWIRRGLMAMGRSGLTPAKVRAGKAGPGGSGLDEGGAGS